VLPWNSAKAITQGICQGFKRRLLKKCGFVIANEVKQSFFQGIYEIAASSREARDSSQ